MRNITPLIRTAQRQAVEPGAAAAQSIGSRAALRPPADGRQGKHEKTHDHAPRRARGLPLAWGRKVIRRWRTRRAPDVSFSHRVASVRRSVAGFVDRAAAMAAEHRRFGWRVAKLFQQEMNEYLLAAGGSRGPGDSAVDKTAAAPTRQRVLRRGSYFTIIRRNPPQP